MRRLIKYYIFLLFLFVSCLPNSNNNTNKTSSHEIDDKEKRIEILKNKIISKSDFFDAEFDLFNVNGFDNSRMTVPGASSSDYKFAIKINTADVENWTEGMIKSKSSNTDNSWMKEIIKKRKNQWITNSNPEFYTRQNNNVIMIVYRNEGIIFKRVVIN